QRDVAVLLEQELHVRGAVEIRETSGYSRSSRISASTCSLGGPPAGPLGLAAAIPRRSACGIVAPRAATSRAIGASGGPDGVRRATSRPRSVTTKLLPSLTWSRKRERFWRRSRTPTGVLSC